jgi:uncharacterized membrane protein YgcG
VTGPRRLSAVLLLAGLATGFAELAAVAAANPTVLRTDGSDATGSTTTSNTCFHVTATVPHSLTGAGATATLTIDDPSGGSHAAGSATVSRSSDKTITFQLNTGALSWANSCSGNAPAPNGTYTAKLSGAVSGGATFRVAVPPVDPSGFSASVDGTIVDFDWNANNDEPDLTAYDIVEDGGTDVTPGGLDPQSVCGGGDCAVSLQFPSSVAGTSHSFVVQAARRGTSSVGTSGAASVRFPAAPTPTPSPTGGGSTGGKGTGSGSGGGGGTSTGGKSGGSTGRGTLGNGKHPARDLSHALPSLALAGGAPNLPSVLTEVKPLPQGTFKPKLPYGSQVGRSAEKQRTTTQRVVNEISDVLDTRALWRGLAAAAILMLIAAHIRTWVERAEVD